MPVTVEERPVGTRRANGRSGERQYIIRGAADEAAAKAALLSGAEVPTAIGDLTRQDKECGVEEILESVWLGTAVYGITDLSIFPGEQFSISFDISGQTQRVTQSLRTVGRFSQAGDNAPPVKDFRGAINVQPDKSIEGVDIIVPFLNYTFTRRFIASEVTTAYIQTLTNAVGTVNNGDHYGSAAGEKLLTRVSGQRRTDAAGDWDIAFGFAVSRNATGIVIGEFQDGPNGSVIVPEDAIVVTAKRGWDYLWVYREPKKVGTGADASVHPVPHSAYCEQVYRYTNFDLLNI